MNWRTIKEKMRKWIITLLIKLIQRTGKDSILIISRKGDTASIKECGKWPDNWTTALINHEGKMSGLTRREKESNNEYQLRIVALYTLNPRATSRSDIEAIIKQDGYEVLSMDKEACIIKIKPTHCAEDLRTLRNKMPFRVRLEVCSGDPT